MNSNTKIRSAASAVRGWGATAAGGGHRYPQEEHSDGKKILERISRETGGRLFEVSKKQPIDQIYAAIAEELRNQYSLGYTPDPTLPRLSQNPSHDEAEGNDRPDERRILLESIVNTGMKMEKSALYRVA